MTEPGTFTLASGTPVEVPFMHSNDKNQYASGPGWQAVALPYFGHAAMLLVVPDSTLADLEAKLDSDLLAQVKGGLSERLVDLALPRWESELEAELVEPLKAMGMTDAFDMDLADLTGIADVRPANLFIKHVMHQANVTVDEDGTEAAAATAVVVELESGAPPVALAVDRPFLYFVVDDGTGEILFMGRVTDPR